MPLVAVLYSIQKILSLYLHLCLFSLKILSPLELGTLTRPERPGILTTSQTKNKREPLSLSLFKFLSRDGVIQRETMEGVRKGSESGSLTMVVVLMCAVMVMVPGVSAAQWIVGGNRGWNDDLNCTDWTEDKQFYIGDSLVFKYNMYRLNVLEVNKTDYETCIPDHPLHNWTGGAGRDVVPLDVTRNYYFISNEQSCSFGMRLAINVDNLPPPSSKSNPSTLTSRVNIGLLMVFAIDALWDAFFRC